MKLGVKIGPEKWREVLEASQAQYCEVWFRLDWADRFGPIFDYLKTHKINFGLHFWAQLATGLEPNLAWEKNGVAQQSQRLMEQTIDIASRFGAVYVNVHPGSLTLKKLYLNEERMELVSDDKIEPQVAFEALLRHCQTLNDYALRRKVLFLVETLPKNDLTQWHDIDSGRLAPQPTLNISPELIVGLAQQGSLITNDIGHLASAWETDDLNWLWAQVFDFSQKLASQTRLVHLNTIVSPFNGTDSHGGVLDSDFAAGAFPNRDQLIQLLRWFKNRDDVWIIPEPPAEVMVQNYHAIKTLLQEV